jgi:hypothetical protein
MIGVPGVLEEALKGGLFCGAHRRPDDRPRVAGGARGRHRVAQFLVGSLKVLLRLDDRAEAAGISPALRRNV